MQIEKNIIEKLEEIVLINDKTVKVVIAKTILNLLKERDDFIINDVANISFTSVSSITKFCKNLGFAGWKEFYAFLKTEKKRQLYQNKAYSTLQESNTDVIINKIIENHSLLVSSTLDHNMEPIMNLVKKINKANKIYVIGNDRYLNLSNYFYHQLLILGYDTYFTTYHYVAKKLLEKVSPTDLIVGILLHDETNYLYNLIQSKINVIPELTFTLIDIKPTVEQRNNNEQPDIVIDPNHSMMSLSEIAYNSLFIIINTVLQMLNENRIS
ncbi:MurR/RpiR family transcriptional regulator [Spiroplasma sp. DGKH1]|uniref:MurR/RpiR family transcriptional regulator n=1 Tax=Spiroplasma sp. DGKH1 TaxID=3050074 RepID=UPI0034C697A5